MNMKWKSTTPQSPGLYWYIHKDAKQLDEGLNTPEPVKLTSDGRVLFIGDWRGHDPHRLPLGLWGDRITVASLT
jgi:hypothetical protein